MEMIQTTQKKTMIIPKWLDDEYDVYYKKALSSAYHDLAKDDKYKQKADEEFNKLDVKGQIIPLSILRFWFHSELEKIRKKK